MLKRTIAGMPHGAQKRAAKELRRLASKRNHHGVPIVLSGYGFHLGLVITDAVGSAYHLQRAAKSLRQMRIVSRKRLKKILRSAAKAFA